MHLWYGVYGLGLRPDVAFVNVNLYGYEWYRRALAERHRGLLPSSGEVPPLDSLIRALAAVRPVYAAEDLGLEFPVDTGDPPGVLTPILNDAQINARAAMKCPRAQPGVIAT